MQTVAFTFFDKDQDMAITLTTENTPDAYQRVMNCLQYDAYYMRQPMVTEDGGLSYKTCTSLDTVHWLKHLSTSVDPDISGRAALMLQAEMRGAVAPDAAVRCIRVARALDFSDKGIQDYEDGIAPKGMSGRGSRVRRTRVGKKVPRNPY